MKSTMRRKEAIEGYIGILPWLVGYLAFLVIPLVAAFFLSFTYWDIFTPIRWAGTRNYSMLLRDKMLLLTLWNTIRYTIAVVPITTALGLIIALLMNQRLKAINVFRIIFYLPSVLPGVAVAILWVWILNPEFGIINSALSFVGIQGPMWLMDKQWAMWGIILRASWGVGGGMILFLAALQNVSPTYYEAALIDGANSWHKFWKITLPMITPTIFFFVVIGVIGAFQEFVLFRVMTGGGPSNSTMTYVLRLFNIAFGEFNVGYGAAMAWLMFIFILLITVVLFKSSGWVYYESRK